MGYLAACTRMRPRIVTMISAQLDIRARNVRLLGRLDGGSLSGAASRQHEDLAGPGRARGYASVALNQVDDNRASLLTLGDASTPVAILMRVTPQSRGMR